MIAFIVDLFQFLYLDLLYLIFWNFLSLLFIVLNLYLPTLFLLLFLLSLEIMISLYFRYFIWFSKHSLFLANLRLFFHNLLLCGLFLFLFRINVLFLKIIQNFIHLRFQDIPFFDMMPVILLIFLCSFIKKLRIIDYFISA